MRHQAANAYLMGGLLILGAVLGGGAGLRALGNREFVLTFRPVEKAKYYEIQFLEAAPRHDSPPSGPIERFSGTSFRRVVPDDYRFFRIRAVADRDVPGLWSSAHPVDRYIKVGAQVFRSVIAAGRESPVLFLVNQSLGLRASDRGSGKTVIFYSLNGAPEQEYRAPLTFDEDGGYSLRWYGVDGVGNREASQSAAFFVDRTAPKLSLTFRVPLVVSHGRLFTAPANGFSIRASDELSGVSGIFCRLLGEREPAPAFSPCAASFQMADFAPKAGNGVYLLEYFAEDRLGNRSALHRVEIRRPIGRQIALSRLPQMGLPAPSF